MVDPNGLVENLKKSVKGMAESPRAILLLIILPRNCCQRPGAITEWSNTLLTVRIEVEFENVLRRVTQFNVVPLNLFCKYVKIRLPLRLQSCIFLYSTVKTEMNPQYYAINHPVSTKAEKLFIMGRRRSYSDKC